MGAALGKKEFTKFEKESNFTILLLGQTGAGKTSLLNLIANFKCVLDLLFAKPVLTLDELRAFGESRVSDISLENDLDDLMASKTSDAKIYEIELAPNWHFTIIDTPGFGDSRGLETDKKHVERIIACLQKVTSINCVMLVMNGRDSRMTTTMKYVMAQLMAVMPRSVLQHVVIAFTNTEKKSKLNFKVACLKEAGLDSPPFECIDNPFGEVHDALEDPDDIDQERLSGFSQDLKRTLHTMEKLGSKAHDMQPVPSNCFAELNDKREEIEALLANNLERISKLIA